jgi:hypothetical protein
MAHFHADKGHFVVENGMSTDRLLLLLGGLIAFYQRRAQGGRTELGEVKLTPRRKTHQEKMHENEERRRRR